MNTELRHQNKFSFPKQVNRYILVAAVMGISLLLPRLNATAQSETGTAAPTAAASTAQIVSAANTFLASLTDAQRKAVQFDFGNTTQRKNWSNFPTGLYNRAGLSYVSLSDAQRTAALLLIKTALSEKGYQKVLNIMTGDEVLLQSGEGGNVGGASFGFGQYYVSILGTPSETSPWILQWGGHHLALNITFSGANEVLTPSHTGCQPCTYIVKDQQVSALGDEHSKALKLLNALDANQKAKAVLNYAVGDLVLGPGQEDRVLEPEGLPGSAMTADQQAALLDLASEWVNIATDAAAATRMAELKTQINDTYFAWSGATSGDTSAAYFRITGPALLIEFSPQGLGCTNVTSGGGGRTPGGAGAGGPGGNNQATGSATAQAAQTPVKLDLGNFSVVKDAGTLCHVHTIYRDPTNPYGSKTVTQ